MRFGYSRCNGTQTRFPAAPEYPAPVTSVKRAILAQDRHSTYFGTMMRLPVALIALSTVACSSVPAQAQVPDPEPPRQIHVNAQASVKRAPDRAVIQLAVETLAETAREATTRNAQAMERVLDAVAALGIPEERIQTRRIEIHPQYNHGRNVQEPEIVAYRAINQVMVRVDDLDLVGRVVDAAVGAGANRVTGINFSLADPEAAYHEALRMAIDEARDEARVVADALGETLGPPLQVSTSGFHVPVAVRGMEAARMDVAASAAPPVEPGELDVQANVSITYRLGT